MRVILAVPVMAAGGAERVVAELVHGLTARGHDILVTGAAGPADAYLDGATVRRAVTRDSGRSLVGAATTLSQLRSIIQRFGPDVVHAQNVKAAGVAGIA